MSRGGGWLLAAAVCAAGALGLSWSGQLAGAAHPARVLVVAAVLLTVAGWRQGRDQLLTAAVVSAAVGLLLGGLDASPGRLALAAAAACLVLAGRAAGRRVLPRRTAA
ncbi:hypothetical protein [Modestobacter lacusdianchii]